MSRKSSNVKKTGSVPTSVGKKTTARDSSGGVQSMSGSHGSNPASAIKGHAMGKKGGTTC